MAGIRACINRPSFPSLLANPLFEVSKSNSQQPFRPILQNAQLLWQKPMTRLFKLGFGFLLGLLILWKDSKLVSVANMFDFSHYNLYLSYLVNLPYLVILSQYVFYHVCCISCPAVVSLLAVLVILLQHPFITFTVFNIFCRNFLLHLLLRVLLLTHYSAVSIYTYILFLMFSKIYINTYKYIYEYMYVYI